MAVLRADGPLPAGAGVVAVLRNNVVVIAAPARHKLEHIPDLKGKRLGLVARTTRDEEAVARLLDVFDLKPADVALTLVKSEEVGALTKSGRNPCCVGDWRSGGSRCQCNCLFSRRKTKRAPDTPGRGYRRISKREHRVREQSYDLQTRFFATKHSGGRRRYGERPYTLGGQQSAHSANQGQTVQRCDH